MSLALIVGGITATYLGIALGVIFVLIHGTDWGEGYAFFSGLIWPITIPTLALWRFVVRPLLFLVLGLRKWDRG